MLIKYRAFTYFFIPQYLSKVRSGISLQVGHWVHRAGDFMNIDKSDLQESKTGTSRSSGGHRTSAGKNTFPSKVSPLSLYYKSWLELMREKSSLEICNIIANYNLIFFLIWFKKFEIRHFFISIFNTVSGLRMFFALYLNDPSS